jgi:hypothetical protein
VLLNDSESLRHMDLYACQLTIAVLLNDGEPLRHMDLYAFQLTIAVLLNDSEPTIAVLLNDSKLLRRMDLLTPRTLQLQRMSVCLLQLSSVSSYSSRNL